MSIKGVMLVPRFTVWGSLMRADIKIGVLVMVVLGVGTILWQLMDNPAEPKVDRLPGYLTQDNTRGASLAADKPKSSIAAPVVRAPQAPSVSLPAPGGDPAGSAPGGAAAPLSASPASPAERRVPPVLQPATPATRPAAEPIPTPFASAPEPVSDDPSVRPTVSTPPSQPVPAPRAEPALAYTVQAGDSLTSIARDHYDNDELVAAILKANPELKNPDRLLVGQKLRLPPKEEAERLARGDSRPSATSELVPPGGVSPPAGRPVAAPPTQPAGKFAAYVVADGDTLVKIAREVLKDAARWRELYELNRDVIGAKPDDIRAGMKLRIPTPASAPRRP